MRKTFLHLLGHQIIYKISNVYLFISCLQKAPKTNRTPLFILKLEQVDSNIVLVMSDIIPTKIQFFEYLY
jgi:hypothetical protein